MDTLQAGFAAIDVPVTKCPSSIIHNELQFDFTLNVLRMVISFDLLTRRIDILRPNVTATSSSDITTIQNGLSRKPSNDAKFSSFSLNTRSSLLAQSTATSLPSDK
jgi:hypothetical protein